MNHGDIVREALNFGYGGDPNYRPFYEDGITALDALLATVERLTAERDEWKRGAISWTEIAGGHKAVADDERARAEAAEREVERLTAERDEAVMKKARMDNWGYSDRGLRARAEAAEREVERLTAERDAALHRAEGWVQHDTEAYAAQSMRALKRAEAAERERDELLTFWPDKYDELQVKVQEWATRARAAEALAERRGEALRRIAELRNDWDSTGDDPWDPVDSFWRAVEIADAALADEGQHDPSSPQPAPTTPTEPPATDTQAALKRHKEGRRL